MTNRTPQVTVYAPTFNEARQIRDVLEGIKRADEIILVDSFSTDVKNSGGRYFHYGYALEPSQARTKHGNLADAYGNAKQVKSIQNRPARFYDDDMKVKPIQGTPPAVMRDLANKATWTYTSRSPLIRLRKNYFWEDIALLIERCTGVTLGMHKNHRLLP
jgi:hypothetical protein